MPSRWSRSVLGAAVALTGCTSLVELEGTPDTSSVRGGIAVLVRDGEVRKLIGYEAAPELDRLVLRKGDLLYMLLYPSPLNELGLELPLTQAFPSDPRSVALPVASEEVQLVEQGDTLRWVGLTERPAVLEDLRVRGVTPELCASGGGCFEDEAARERLQCDFGCPDAIAFEVETPELPRLSDLEACPSGWVRTDESYPLDGRLADAGLRAIAFRSCRARPSLGCNLDSRQVGETCQPLSDCAIEAQLAALRPGAPIAYVPNAPPGGPPGDAFETLSEAVSEASATTNIAVGPGVYALPEVLPEGVVIVGRCSAETTLTMGPVHQAGGGEVMGVRLSAAPSTTLAGSWILRAVRLQIFAGRELTIESKAELFLRSGRIHSEVPGPPGRYIVEGRGRLESSHLSGSVEVEVRPEARLELSDVRVEVAGAGTPLTNAGRLTVERTVISDVGGAQAPLVRQIESGRMAAFGLEADSQREGGFSFELAGTSSLAGAFLSLPGIRVAGEGSRLFLDDVDLFHSKEDTVDPALVVSDGAELSASRLRWFREPIVADHGAIVIRDSVAKGDPLEVVDAGDFFELGEVRRYVPLLVDGGSASVERTAFVDSASAVQGRRSRLTALEEGEFGFEIELEDVVVSRSVCEPFVFGPGPYRQGRDETIKVERPCTPAFFNARYPYPHDAEPGVYADPYRVRMSRVWARSAGVAQPMRNEISVVGRGVFEATDVRFLRATARGLLMMGDVRFDLQRLSFEDAGVQGACFFPALRLEPTPNTGEIQPADPYGRIDGFRSLDMDVGFMQLLGRDVEPPITLERYLVENASLGILRALPEEKTVEVPIPIDRFIVDNALVDVEVLQGATPNENCD